MSMSKFEYKVLRAHAKEDIKKCTVGGVTIIVMHHITCELVLAIAAYAHSRMVHVTTPTTQSTLSL